jgi:hypothetical protein
MIEEARDLVNWRQVPRFGVVMRRMLVAKMSISTYRSGVNDVVA